MTLTEVKKQLRWFIEGSICHDSDIESYMACLLADSSEHFTGLVLDVPTEAADEIVTRRAWVVGNLKDEELTRFDVIMIPLECEEAKFGAHLLYPHWRFKVVGDTINLFEVTVEPCARCNEQDFPPYVLIESDDVGYPGAEMSCYNCAVTTSLRAEDEQALQKLEWILQHASPAGLLILQEWQGY